MRYDLLRKRWKHELREEQRIVEMELRATPFIRWKQSLGELHLSIEPEYLAQAKQALAT